MDLVMGLCNGLYLFQGLYCNYKYGVNKREKMDNAHLMRLSAQGAGLFVIGLRTDGITQSFPFPPRRSTAKLSTSLMGETI